MKAPEEAKGNSVSFSMLRWKKAMASCEKARVLRTA